MKIFILHNKMKPGSYAYALLELLTGFLTGKHFLLYEYHDIKNIKDHFANDEKSVVVFHTGKKELSFFSRINLQSVIKKQGFNYLIQVTDSRFLSSDLPQLILSNHAGSLKTESASEEIIYAVCSSADEKKTGEQNIGITHQLKQISLAANDDFHSASWSEQQGVKMQYTQGREYFLALAEGKTIPSVTGLLKAFSTFKKWQQSNMKLVIAGRLSFSESEDWTEKIGTYKFREDVILLNHVNKNERVQIVAAAYAFLHFPNGENDILPVLQSLACETPVISFVTKSIEEYGGEAITKIDTDNYDQLAEKMILLYKDEALRNRLIDKGKKVSQYYTKQKTFQALTEALAMPAH